MGICRGTKSQLKNAKELFGIKIKRPSPQRENLIKWLDLFGSLQYTQPIKIVIINGYETLYEGLLKDMRYKDMLVIEQCEYYGLMKTNMNTLVIYADDSI